MTVREWLAYARGVLENDAYAHADAVWIIEEALSIPRARLGIEGGRELSDGEMAALEAPLRRRAGGEPVQYIFSRAPFMGYEFYVDARVLIPRMDTETLCEAAAEFMRARPGAAALDLCAGSGAIGISLARMFPAARVTLSDISSAAAQVQRVNARAQANVEILTGDMFETVAGRRFDLIVCNPPYIPTRDLRALAPEVRREPALALDGGADGLDFYRRLSREYKNYLLPGGRIYMEIGFDQAQAVRALFENARLVRDLGGNDRVIWTEV